MDNLQQRYAVEADGNGFVAGLLCGAAIGAAIGLMFAPKPGVELRQTLYDSTGELCRKASDMYAQATKTVPLPIKIQATTCHRPVRTCSIGASNSTSAHPPTNHGNRRSC